MSGKGGALELQAYFCLWNVGLTLVIKGLTIAITQPGSLLENL